jgi:hypothetical protein
MTACAVGRHDIQSENRDRFASPEPPAGIDRNGASLSDPTRHDDRAVNPNLKIRAHSREHSHEERHHESTHNARSTDRSTAMHGAKRQACVCAAETGAYTISISE